MDAESNINTKNVLEILSTLKNALAYNSIDLLYILSDIQLTIDKSTAPLILGIIPTLVSSQDKIQNHLRPSFKYYLKRILEDLKDLVPMNLYLQVESIVSEPQNQTKTTSENNGLDVFMQIKQIVNETLVKKTMREISNAVINFFNKGTSSEGESKHFDTKIVLEYFNLAKSKQVAVLVKMLSYLFTENDAESILNFLNEKNPEICNFFLAIRFINKDLYDSLAEHICTEKRFFKKHFLTALPELDMDAVIQNIKDYNWDILEQLIKSHPDITEDVIDNFNLGKIGMSRKDFLEKVCELDYYFSYHISKLGLSKEELSDVLQKSNLFSLRFFYTITSENEMIDFVKIVSKKNETSILDLIKMSQSLSNFKLFLKFLTSYMRFTGDLKKYVVENFAREMEYFHILITYLETEEIESLLDKFYQKNVSLEGLLKKYHPQELIIELHKFKNVKLANTMIDECITSPSITDNDWILSMKSLQSVSSPEILLKTCQNLLSHGKNLENEILEVLRGCITDSTLKKPALISILTKCLELLGENSIYIFETLDRKTSKKIVDSSSPLSKMINSIIKRSENSSSDQKIHAFKKYFKNTFK